MLKLCSGASEEACHSSERGSNGNDGAPMETLPAASTLGQPAPSGGTTSQMTSLLTKPRLLWQVRNREGYNPPRLYRPHDVAFLWDNRAVVVEGFYPYSRIQILDTSGNSIKSIAQGDILPYGITIDPEGYMAITDHKDRTVKFFTPDGDFGLSWQPNMFDWPDGIANTRSGHYVITDKTQGMVSMHDIDGVKIKDFSSADPASSQYSCPSYITIDAHHRIILTDTYDHTVKIFDQNGRYLHKIDQPGSEASKGCIKDPRGVTTDQYSNIVVADWGSNCVKMFSADGRFIQNILDSDDDVKHPWGVAFNNAGQLLMSEQKLDSSPALKLYQCYS